MEIEVTKHMIEEAVIALDKAGMGRLEDPETFAIARVVLYEGLRASTQITVSEENEG